MEMLLKLMKLCAITVSRVGIKDYSNPGSTVAIFNDFNAHCDCAEGLVYGVFVPLHLQ